MTIDWNHFTPWTSLAGGILLLFVCYKMYRQIREGQKVVMFFISADYDDRQFPDPFRFDIHRTPNEHVAFGRMSPHLCLGAQLARMELKVLFEELLPRISDAQLAGPIDRLRSNFISGMKRVPVTVSLA